MSQEREYVHVEVNVKNHLCRVWYGSKEMLWYGGLIEMDEVQEAV
jgi:hypothetical protein